MHAQAEARARVLKEFERGQLGLGLGRGVAGRSTDTERGEENIDGKKEDDEEGKGKEDEKGNPERECCPD